MASASRRARVVLITTCDSESRSIFPFHQYTDDIGAWMLTQAARRSSTSVRAMVSASSSGAVVRTRMTSVISALLYRRFAGCTLVAVVVLCVHSCHHRTSAHERNGARE